MRSHVVSRYFLGIWYMSRCVCFNHSKVGGHRFFFAFIGLKGDWPYLRKMMALASGFTCKRVCHYCATSEWWKFGKNGCLHAWNRDSEPLPWKPRHATFMQVPGASDPRRIRTDMAHTWAIGVGKEFVASALLLLGDLKLFQGNMDVKLESAYANFRLWCYENHQSSKLTDFSFRTLKISSIVGPIVVWDHVFVWVARMFLYQCELHSLGCVAEAISISSLGWSGA